jgi:hypothetical protein
LHQVEGFTSRHIFGLWDVQEDNITEFGCRTPMGTSRSNVSGSNDADFCASHAQAHLL